MKTRQVLSAATALALMIAFSAEKSGAVGPTTVGPAEPSRSQTIRYLQRTSKAPELAVASVRDPFFGPEPAPMATGEISPGKS